MFAPVHSVQAALQASQTLVPVFPKVPVGQVAEHAELYRKFEPSHPQISPPVFFKVHYQPALIVAVFEHPSVFMLFPSSHASVPTLYPSMNYDE